MGSWRLMFVLVAFAITLMLAAGCASRERQHPSANDTTIERPARPIGEEQSFADRIGEVGVVILVVVVTVGGILLPILLL